MDTEYVDKNICILRHEVQDTKILAIEKDLDNTKDDVKEFNRIVGEIKDLQVKTLYGILGVFVMVILVLVGVLLGRGIDFGLLVAGV